ncbi:MAG: phosphate signaling complex protein PhoU [Deltaproteobacteria bacterium]|nr:phosphate signaling complex protein PhoU [Deltaproteobacteria bacterium]
MTDKAAAPPPEPPDKFHRELAELKERLLHLARLAEAAIDRAVTALLENSAALARQVIVGDGAINDLEEAIDAHCVRLIALYQPVAIDLRQVMAVDHLIMELERIGDLAVNIAEEALTLTHFPREKLHPELPRMAQMVLDMVRRSLTAFMEQDPAAAREVCRADDDVDHLDRSIIQDLLGDMVDTEAIPVCQSQINVVRHLERVGDHATNIAEQVVYMVEGESVRHRCQG